jgi:uncharacterized iron-regulated membrane protein
VKYSMIRKLRAALFWMHLAVGVVAGLFILNMAASGILIAYSKQITALVESGQKRVSPPPGAKLLDVETLVAKVQTAQPRTRLSGVVLYADPSASAMFYVGRGNNVLYADPYTGEIKGDGNKPVRGFFQFVTSWHRWLALEGTARPIGQVITGTVAIAFFVLVLTGLVLWLPRQWSRLRLNQGTILDPALRGKPRDWNWHNVVGLWSAPLLLLVTMTAVIMSHDWATDLLYRLTGNPVPPHRQERPRNGEGVASNLDLSGLNPLWAQAETKVPDWHSISLRISSSPDAPASFFIDRGDGSRPDTVAQLSLDRETGEVVRWQPYANQNAGQSIPGRLAGFWVKASPWWQPLLRSQWFGPDSLLPGAVFS